MTATSRTIHINEASTTGAKSAGLNLYRAGGMAALLAVLVALTDISLTFFPAGAEPPGTMTAVDWFHLFQQNWFFGLRNLGLLPNIFTLLLFIPLFLALYTVHKTSDRAFATTALIFSLLGTAIYLANNAAFPMWALSVKYAAAITESQRTLFAAAGEAILARGEDFTPGAFPGFILSEVATVTISIVMLRGRVFSKATAYAGILGCFFLTLFTIWSTFIPVFFELSMLVAMLGGLLNIAWYILTARRLFQLARE